MKSSQTLSAGMWSLGTHFCSLAHTSCTPLLPEPPLPPPCKTHTCRGKCTVSLLNELEDVAVYLQKEDTFFYTMVYDPNQKTLLVDKGEIRVGPDYQAEIPPYISPGTCATYPVSSIPLVPRPHLLTRKNGLVLFGNRPKKFDFVHQTVSCCEVCYNTSLTLSQDSLTPRPSHRPVLIYCSMQKWAGEKAWK